MKRPASLLLPLALALLLPSTEAVLIKSVTRNLDLQTQLVKASHSITFLNDGRGDAKVESVAFSVDPSHADHVVFVGAKQDRAHLRLARDPSDRASYTVELRQPLSPGGECVVEVEVTLAKALSAFPAEISQREQQLALFTGNHYLYSPYKVQSQTTTVKLPAAGAAGVEAYSKHVKPVSLSDSTLTYGPYADVDPFSREELTVHYENNSPFLIVSRLERVIEVSMWGNIAVEETLDVRHAGAALKGSFSRYEFQRENSGVAAVKQFKTVLPAAASDVYYRDDIGNISTSALRELDDAVELELRPRFPLFGGWKTHYTIGYNVPSYEYLFHAADAFALSMRVVDHVFDDMLVEQFALKIILPEGAKVGQLHTPFPMRRLADSLHFTYLDTAGRPVVSVENVAPLTEKHIEDFQLDFAYPRTTMVREPLLLVAAFFLFFALTIVYVRLDFSITRDEGSEARMKAAGICDKILAHQDRRSAAYAAFDDAVARYKTGKDHAAFAAAQRKVNADLKTETQSITDLVPALKAVQGEAADRVNEIQKNDRALRDHLSNHGQVVEKLVGGKLTKAQFLELEPALLKKKAECKERMASIAMHLRAY